jgi:ribosomal protein S12 methylthiotransferase accessory factor
VSAEINLVLAAATRRTERHPNAVLNEAVPKAVVSSATDPARLCPMLAGAALVKGDRLTVRTATAEVVINAPAPLLRSVFDRCDGTRTIDEVLVGIEDAASRREFSDFLHFLIEQGALIDANLTTVSAARYALQGNPFGLAAHPSVTNQICRRFLWSQESAPARLPVGTVTVGATPLDDVFDTRVSTYTFDERDIGVEALHALLWSLAGVVRTKHDRIGFVTPKRTVASAGGMQLAKVFVALQRKVGTYEPGVYRVQYPCERGLALTRVSDQSHLTPRAFGKPWELTFATGAVFVVAEPAVAAMRYRNRALQYLFMEAGAILHNGGLTAPQLGLGYATIGSYYETTVSRMCRLEGEMVLGSAIFGPKPTAEQVRWIDRSPDVDFAWVDGASPQFSMPFHLGRAKMKTADDARLHTWGRDANPWLAARKAVAEAVEREGFREPRGIVNARLTSLRSAVDPREFVRYAPEQHALDGFAYQPFDADHMYSWAGGTELNTGVEVHVLAELVFSRTSLAAAGHAVDRPYTQVTSSGCAAGVSKDDAVLRALLEVVERDAFMRHWLAQRPGALIPQSSLPAEIAARVEALAPRQRVGACVPGRRAASRRSFHNDGHGGERGLRVGNACGVGRIGGPRLCLAQRQQTIGHRPHADRIDRTSLRALWAQALLPAGRPGVVSGRQRGALRIARATARQDGIRLGPAAGRWRLATHRSGHHAAALLRRSRPRAAERRQDAGARLVADLFRPCTRTPWNGGSCSSWITFPSSLSITLLGEVHDAKASSIRGDAQGRAAEGRVFAGSRQANQREQQVDGRSAHPHAAPGGHAARVQQLRRSDRALNKAPGGACGSSVIASRTIESDSLGTRAPNSEAMRERTCWPDQTCGSSMG